jgi:hypothetical protein
LKKAYRKAAMKVRAWADPWSFRDANALTGVLSTTLIRTQHPMLRRSSRTSGTSTRKSTCPHKDG